MSNISETGLLRIVQESPITIHRHAGSEAAHIRRQGTSVGARLRLVKDAD